MSQMRKGGEGMSGTMKITGMYEATFFPDAGAVVCECEEPGCVTCDWRKEQAHFEEIRKRDAIRNEIARRKSRRLFGNAGETTADAFDVTEGGVPLFNKAWARVPVKAASPVAEVEDRPVPGRQYSLATLARTGKWVKSEVGQ